MTTRGPSKLAALLVERRGEIVDRFVQYARSAGAAEALPREEIINSLRVYLGELASHLRVEWETGRSMLDARTVASEHGEHRFLHGFDLTTVIREYGALRELLCDIIAEHEDIPFGEMRILFRHLVAGIAESAARYGALRDADLRERTAQHIAFLAHELRNPLSSARMAVTLLSARPEMSGSRHFAALDRSLTKASRLLDDALSSVRLRDAVHLHYSQLAIGDLVRELIDESEEEAGAAGITFHVEGDAHIRGDRKALGSALSNLLRNAVKFSKSGGDVHVRIRPLEARLVIEVEDCCGGLPEGAVRKLFDPFVQAGADRSGFGLGLAIAKQAAEAHEGEIRVHDLPGKGCVFVLDLPREYALPSPTAEASPNLSGEDSTTS